MRRISVIFALALSVAFVGAAPRAAHRPAPRPAASAIPTAPPQAAVPTVVVFPFGISNNIKAGSGDRAAQLFAQVMRQAGGLAVVDGGADVARVNFLTTAQKLHADYYVGGYMTLLGDSVSLVEQLVDARTGVIIFARTAQIADVNDATAQAQAIHDSIITRENSFQASLSQAAAPAASPTPLPNNEANIGQLFKRRTRAAAAPAIAPVQKPAKGIFVAPISGSLSSGELTAGTSALRDALDGHFTVRGVSPPNGDLAKGADGICGNSRDNTIASGVASTTSVKVGFFRKTQYEFALRVYTCFGSVLASSNGSGSTLAGAITAAVAAYAATHPQNS